MNVSFRPPLIGITPTDEEVLACDGTGVLPCVPKTQTSNSPNLAQDSIYGVKNDHYTCPAGKILTKGAAASWFGSARQVLRRSSTPCFPAPTCPLTHPFCLVMKEQALSKTPAGLACQRARGMFIGLYGVREDGSLRG
jgi:hypothetical protein